MRTHSTSHALSLAVVIFGGLAAWLTAAVLPVVSHAASQARVRPITNPMQQPRLAFEDLKYAGAFRLPAAEVNGGSFSFGGGPIAFHAEKGTLFVGSRAGVAEITVPAPVNSAEIGELPFAEFVQPFADPAEGRMKDIADDAGLAGLMVYEGRLYGTSLIYYDANNTQAVSHFVRPLVLAKPGAGPIRRVGEKGRIGFVAGYMAPVPVQWQSRLGAPAITGQCCVPIVSRTSMGPAAFAWTPADLLRDGDVPAAPLVYYDTRHPTLGAYEGSNPTYGGTTTVGGVAIIPGTRTALFVGSTGTGPFCYGIGTSDRSLAGTTGPDNEKYCYDPTTSDKGQHAFPYRYQMWAYDLIDWAEVRAGRKDPWEVRPYAVWTFDLPTPEPGTRIAGVSFDPERRRLFVSQRRADQDGFAFRALIHVYQVE